MTKHMASDQLLQVLAQLAAPRVLVLGDLILDRYTWGNAERVSQEAPVVVLHADHREARLGGAASVCSLVRGLDARVDCAGVIGNDEAGRSAAELLERFAIGRQLVLTDPGRPTTSKERFIGRAASRHPNQMLRVDCESRQPLSESLETRLLEGLRACISDYDILLISDYGKGVCRPTVVQAAIRLARDAGIPSLVDPARSPDSVHYRQATAVKPNRTESELATGIRISGASEALQAGRKLCEMLDLEMAIITLDRDGMALVQRDGHSELFATEARTVYDITGAGDIVLAMLGVCLGCGVPASSAVQLANVAAGLEVERTGVAIVTRDEIRQHLLARGGGGRHKVVTLDEAARLCALHRTRQQRVVMTNGCFDLLHVGHISYLAETAALGDVLVVAINSDASVGRLKGPQRPVMGQADRAAMLAALSCVDYVLVFDEDTPHRVLEALRPDVLTKGGTYRVEEVVGREVVEAYGGRVHVMGAVPGVSTTNILKSVADRGDNPLRYRQAS